MEDKVSAVKAYLAQSIATKQAVIADHALMTRVAAAVELCLEALGNGNKIIFAGNGGSAADSQHLAAEFVSRFNYDRPGLSAVALTTDTSALTAIGNDYGFEQLFSRQVEATARAGDIFVGITTSGNSKNILRAMEACTRVGVRTIAFTGNGGQAKEMAEIAIDVPSHVTSHIQEAHIAIGHVLCGLIESAMFPRSANVSL